MVFDSRVAFCPDTGSSISIHSVMVASGPSPVPDGSYLSTSGRVRGSSSSPIRRTDPSASFSSGKGSPQ